MSGSRGQGVGLVLLATALLLAGSWLAFPGSPAGSPAAPRTGVEPGAGTTYTVTFSETGLPSDSRWYVNASGGNDGSSTGTTISFSLTNGTYPFTIASARADWLPDPGAGSLRVNGAGVANSLVFYRVYALSINRPVGMISGGSWSASLAGVLVFSAGGVPGTSTVEATTASQIVLREPNGTYGYTIRVAASSGYNDTNSVRIDGKPVTVTPLPAGSKRPVDYLWYLLAVGGIVVVVSGAVALVLRRRAARNSGGDGEEDADSSRADADDPGEPTEGEGELPPASDR